MRSLCAGLLLIVAASPAPAAPNYALDTTIAYRAPDGRWKGGFYGELGLWSPADRALTFGMGVGITKSDFEGQGLFRGPITMVPLTLRARLQMSPGPLAPYVEGGFGYYILDHRLSDASRRSCAVNNKSCSDDIDDAFGGSVGAGMIFNFAANAGLNLFVAGNFVKANARATTIHHDTGQTTVSHRIVKLDSVVVGLKTTVRF